MSVNGDTAGTQMTKMFTGKDEAGHGLSEALSSQSRNSLLSFICKFPALSGTCFEANVRFFFLSFRCP